MDAQLILDRYRPLSELGQGGYGTVTLAWDTRMQRRVAIKRLPLPLDASGVPHRPPGLAEARTAAMLNHPSIVTVFDFDMDSDEAFLVMEHVDGASLADVLDAVDGPLELVEAAAIVDSVAAALEFAHDNGVLHLDIKPENVLVTREGRIKVADFGMAALSSTTGHGCAEGGTPGYMPLEQLEGLRCSERTDEWALAALAVECLTGDNPFWEPTLEAAIVRLEVFEPPLPSRVNPELPDEVDDVLLTGLGQRPADRYPSVSDFADELLPLLGDPAAGASSLAELVDDLAAETPAVDEAPGFESVGLWDRVPGGAGRLAARVIAAVEGAWLAWAGLTPFALGRPATLAAVALVAVAGALAPALGAGLGLGAFAVGIIAAGFPLAGSIALVLSVLWWWFAARRSAAAAVLPLSAPLLSIVRVPYAQPLLAGFALAPRQAALAATVGGSLTMIASAASGFGPPYAFTDWRLAVDVWDAVLAVANLHQLFTSPAALVALAGWPLGALAMSLLSRRASRPAAAAGALLGAGIIYGFASLADLITREIGRSGRFSGPLVGASLAASLILVLLVVLAGPPVRAEEEGFDREPYDSEDDA